MNEQQTEKTDLTFTVVKRAVIYSRVSSDEQTDNTSLPGQEKDSLEYIEYLNQTGNNTVVKVVEMFREDYTGTTLDRPELKVVRAMIRRGEIDMLIAHRPNRLDRSKWGRNLLTLADEMLNYSVELHFSRDRRKVDLNDQNEVLAQVMLGGWQAGVDHAETVRKLYEGRKNRVKNDQGVIVNGRPPYGYNLVKEDKISKLEVNEDEAETVRQIFDWYIKGMTYDQIAAELTRLQVPTSMDTSTRKKAPVKKRGYAEWSKQSVRYIATNETYIGKWHYGKTKRIKDKKTGRNKVVTRPKEQWLEVAVPAIVSQEVWNAAQERKDRFRANSTRKTKYEYLVAKRVTCKCGYKMTGHPKKSKKHLYLYYGCPARGNDRYRKCETPLFRVDRVDTKVWNWIEEICTNREKLEKGIAGYEAATQAGASQVKEDLAAVETTITKQEGKLTEAYESLLLLKNAPDSKARLAHHIEMLEAVLVDLRGQREEIITQLGRDALTEEQKKTIFQFADMIATDIEAFRHSFPSQRKLIELLDVQVLLYVEDGIKMADISARIGKYSFEVETNDTFFISPNLPTKDYIILTETVII